MQNSLCFGNGVSDAKPHVNKRLTSESNHSFSREGGKQNLLTIQLHLYTCKTNLDF